MRQQPSKRMNKWAVIFGFSIVMAGLLALIAPIGIRAEADSTQSNLVTNGIFDGGMQGWQCHNCRLTAGSPAYSGARAAQLVTGTAATRAQLYQTNIPLQPNTQYELRFWARSGGQDIQVELLKHTSPYTNYGLRQNFDVTNTWQEFKFTFRTGGFSQPVSDGRLRFYAPLGKGVAYSIDNVSLTLVGGSNPPPGPTPTPPPDNTPPPSGTGSELVVFDWNKPVTTVHRGFPWDQEQEIRANGNWFKPINYAEGTFYYRAEIRKMPAKMDMRLQFCIWQPAGNDTTKPYKDPYKLENCGSQKAVSYQGNKVVVTWDQKVQDLWKKNGVIIDWSRPRYRNGIAIKNSKGQPVSNYNGWNWNREDPNKWYPMDIRFTVVVVEKGKSFGGWDKYIR